MNEEFFVNTRWNAVLALVSRAGASYRSLGISTVSIT